MKNHIKVNGKIFQTNKRFSQLSNSEPLSVWNNFTLIKSLLILLNALYTSAASLFGPELAPTSSRLKRSTNKHT